MRTAVLVLLGVAAVVLLAVLAGTLRWRSATAALRAPITAARRPVTPATYDPSELSGLPPPVRRYFDAVLTPGQRLVAVARVRHEGTFNLDEAGARWVPFRSDQLVVTQRPGFDWNARVRMAPGVTVRVHDAYIAGEGILHAAILGLVTVAEVRGTPEAAAGELMRYLAEATWYPTALLPSQGVRWDAVDDTTARASLTDGAATVTLEFRFDAAGLIAMVAADARHRMSDGRPVATPWQGRFWNYADRDGMRVPLEGEVGWVLPSGYTPYWRGRIADIVYEWALPG